MPVLFAARGKEVNLYFSVKVINKSRLLAKKIQQSRKFIIDYKKEIQQEEKLLAKYCQELKQKSIRDLTTRKIINLLQKFGELYRQHGVTPIRTLNRIGPGIVRKFFLQKYQEKETDKWLPILFAATRQSVDRRQEKDILMLAGKISTLKKLADKKTAILIFSYLDKYQWLPCGYAEELPLQKKDIIKKLQQILKEKQSPVIKLRQLIKEEKALYQKRKKLLAKLNLPSYIANLVEALSEFIFYKDFIRMNYNKLHFYSRPLFKEAAKRLQVSLKELTYFTVSEIIQFLQRGKIDKRLLLARLRNYLCYTKGKEIEILVGQKAKIKEQQEIEERDKQIAQHLIKGIGASAGYAKGSVKVIKHFVTTEKIPANFILVTPMTTPELVPIAKKALAIITDEGGITCHAAIVSRELKIPCVIGTKIATKIFKDGDKVEIDANKGIVKKIG
ncbi:hypothetical protein KKF32_02075 [Patescibacteria group bacterium]|nr:hypothetical protein [Patescibacteria group bacterium]